jgi:hypothetical protein
MVELWEGFGGRMGRRVGAGGKDAQQATGLRAATGRQTGEGVGEHQGPRHPGHVGHPSRQDAQQPQQQVQGMGER